MVFDRIRKHFLEDEVYLLSTLFTPKDRKKIIKTIKRRLAEKKRTILVSTQVVEAGVDLDFDYGFREFAPFYAIIQTAGRINRENRAEVLQSARLVITSPIGNSPYHETDVLEKEMSELLQNELRENQILPVLKTYFETSIKRTAKETQLWSRMENLDFETVKENFENQFMKSIPSMVPVFIEIRAGLYEAFVSRRSSYLHALIEKGITLEKTMEIKSCLKRVSKYMSNYIINVGKDDADSYPDFENDRDLKVCVHHHVESGVYTTQKGWTGAASLILF
jgi:CRISPR-associated endonuclease/helicase Cas3